MDILMHLFIEKFQKNSFQKGRMINSSMNFLWNVIIAEDKCIKFVFYTLNLFGQMGKSKLNVKKAMIFQEIYHTINKMNVY